MLFVLTHVFSDFNEKFRGISLLDFWEMMLPIYLGSNNFVQYVILDKEFTWNFIWLNYEARVIKLISLEQMKTTISNLENSQVI